MLGMLFFEGHDGKIWKDHARNCAPYHLLHIDGQIDSSYKFQLYWNLCCVEVSIVLPLWFYVMIVWLVGAWIVWVWISRRIWWANGFVSNVCQVVDNHLHVCRIFLWIFIGLSIKVTNFASVKGALILVREVSIGMIAKPFTTSIICMYHGLLFIFSIVDVANI